jgi:hypothetical protein
LVFLIALRVAMEAGRKGGDDTDRRGKRGTKHELKALKSGNAALRARVAELETALQGLEAQRVTSAGNLAATEDPLDATVAAASSAFASGICGDPCLVDSTARVWGLRRQLSLRCILVG